MTKMLQTLETIDNIQNKCVASFPKLMYRYPQTKFQLHFEKNEFFILHSYDQNHLTLLKFFNIYRLNKFQGMKGQKKQKNKGQSYQNLANYLQYSPIGNPTSNLQRPIIFSLCKISPFHKKQLFNSIKCFHISKTFKNGQRPPSCLMPRH